MQVGTHVRITLHGSSEDFVVTDVWDTEFYAASALDAQRLIRIALVNDDFIMPDAPDADVQVLQALTGIPNVDIRILAKLEAETLRNLAELDTHVQTLYQRDELWYAKVEADFGEDVLKFKLADVSARAFYDIYGDIYRMGTDATLITASCRNNINAVRTALRAHANVNATTKDGDTALMYAARNGHIEVVKELLQAGANVNAANMYGNTAVIDAARDGHLEIIRELIKAGADVNAVDMYGGTALIEAAWSGHAEIVRELLQHGANVNATANQRALTESAARGHLAVVQELLQHGADVNDADDDGRTALTYAVRNGHLEIAEELLPYSTDENREDALIEAAGMGRLKLVKELILRDTNVNVTNNRLGITALTYAARNGHLDVVQELLSHGANVNEVNDRGNTALILAARYGQLEVARELILRGADVNAVNDLGYTALITAARYGHLEVVKELIRAGADVNVSVDGLTALRMATLKRHQNIVDFLRAHGAQ